MSVIQITNRQCDECQLQMEDKEGAPPNGWVHLSGEVSIQVGQRSLSNAGEFDFCGRYCMGSFVDSLTASPPVPAKAEPLAIPPPADLPPVSADDIPL